MKSSYKGIRCEDLPDGSVVLPTKLQPSPLNMENNSGFKTVIKPADYIGSFLVFAPTQKDRTEIVYKKLESMRNTTHRKSVLLVVSLSGIKVCNETGESVRMAHALRRISYATSDPDFCQFSFLAREPKGQANAQYCHTFITKTPALAEELNDIVGEAFRLAYARQKQQNRGLLTKTPSFNDIIERQLRRQRPHGMEIAIEEATNESLTSKSDIESQSKEGDEYNLLTSDKSKKSVPPVISKKLSSKNNDSGPISIVKDKLDRSPTATNVTKFSDNNNTDRAVPNALCNPKITPNKPLPVPPTSISHLSSSRQTKNNYDETDDLVAEVLLDHKNINDNTPPWMYANRRVQSAFAPQSQKKPVVGPHQISNQEKNILFPDRPCSGPHPNIKLSSSDQYKLKENAPLPPQRMDSLPSYDLAERGCAEGESGVGTGATSVPGKYHPAVDVSTISIDSTSGSSEKSASHDALMEAMKWPEKWYQPEIPREVALDLLTQGEIGSFVVRDSSSHAGCYALSVKVCKSDNPTGVIHYLIQRTSTGFKLKGLEKEWPTMKSLVTHLTVMPEMLPCTLVLVTQKRHTTTTSNPAFCPIDAPKLSSLGANICDTQNDDEEDIDYQRLSDFSSIMADLCLS